MTKAERPRAQAFFAQLNLPWDQLSLDVSDEFNRHFDEIVTQLENEPDFVVRKKQRKF